MNRVEMNGRAMFGDCIFLSPQFSPSWGHCHRLTTGPLLQGCVGLAGDPGKPPRALGTACPWESGAVGSPLRAPP